MPAVRNAVPAAGRRDGAERMSPLGTPPPPGSRLVGTTGLEWVVVRTTYAEDDPDIWLVHVIKAADAAAGLRHLSLVLTGDEFADFCRDQGIV